MVRQRFRRPRYVSDEELDSLFITAGSEAAHHRSRVRIKYRTELSTELNLLFAGTSLSHLRTAEKIVEWITGERARVRKPSETGTVGSPTGGASVVSDFGLAAEGGCGGDLGCSSMVLVLSVGLLVWLLVGF